MKKIILLLVVATSFLGCSINDDNNVRYEYKVLPIASYTLPANFKLGETYEIKLKYQKPSECYIYQGIYYSKELSKRTIAIQAAVQSNQVCAAVIPAESEVSFNFLPTNTGSYIFKFYKGQDTAGKDVFEEVEIPVVQ